MRVLFLHSNFPAQFRHLVSYLAQNPEHEVVFLTKQAANTLPGVKKVLYAPTREASPAIHRYVRPLETAVLEGQAAYRAAVQLKHNGFTPDVILGHSGWGSTLYMKDLFPCVPFIGYFEWFYQAYGSDVAYWPDETLPPDDECRIRTLNAPILIDLYSCDFGLTPTYWQHSRIPDEYLSKINVIHDGIDTAFCQPKKNARLILPHLGLDLSEATEIVTYVGRGMEPYRGFPQFMEAIQIVMSQRPSCQVVIVGTDRTCYGSPPENGKTYKELLLEKLDLDLNRIHFTGHLSPPDYLRVLQASTVHVYLTRPFVLSWSLLEAMSAGCCIVGSATPPVMEVINNKVNGLLADFRSPADIATKVIEALEQPGLRQALAWRARQTILERYELTKMLHKQLQLLSTAVKR